LNPIRIRLAKPADLYAIYHIEESSFSEPYPHSLLSKLLRDFPNSYLVAEIDRGTIVGYCVASDDGDFAHLISIGVLLKYRRRGVGTALIQELLEKLRLRVRELRLEVNQRNAEAIKLYEDLGFKRTSVIENYYADGSPAVKMELTIHATSDNQSRRKMAT